MASDQVARVRLQRDLYRRLLELSEHDDVAPFAEQALQLVTEVTGAHRGYIELASVLAGDGQRFWLGRGFSEAELAAVRAEVSTGIIAQAVATGKPINTASAVDDPRFAAQGSVQAQRIRAVLCVPLGDPSARGVIYLQGRDGSGPFPREDQQLAEIFARHLAPLSDRLLAGSVIAEQDHTLELRSKLAVDGIAGTSQQLAELFQQMLIAAPVDISVLIAGETGTGKTAVARAIHQSSPRASGPFVELNCAALPEALFESELFGAEKGAHSTATERIAGKADAADGGTLFLDEIGEMPWAVQSKLLTFAQSKRYFPLGATAAVQADVRIIAATNADLPAMVHKKCFREDLYYRLSVLELVVPPLRDRPQDIGPIAEALCRNISATHAKELSLSRAARVALQEATWPGNIRQLDNALQRGWATAMAQGANTIEGQHLFPERPADKDAADPPTYQEAVREFQTRFIRQALRESDWNVSATARQLELSRSHLNDLIKALGLVRPNR